MKYHVLLNATYQFIELIISKNKDKQTKTNIIVKTRLAPTWRF